MRKIITKKEIIKSIDDFKDTHWLVIKNKKGEIIYNEFMENDHTKRKMIDELYEQVLNNESTEFVLDNTYTENSYLVWTVCEATVDITVEALLKLQLL